MRTRLLLTTAVCLLVACTPAASIPAAGSTAQPAPEPFVSEQRTVTTGPVTITFGASRYELDMYRPLIEQFNRDNPDVQVQFVDTQPVIDASMTREVYDGAEEHRQFARAADTFARWQTGSEAEGILLDLKPLMDADPGFAPEDFYPAAKLGSTVDGKLYMLPTTIQLNVLVYNRDLFEAQGVPLPTPDWSWSELVTAAQAIARTKNGAVEQYGMSIFGSAMLFNQIMNTDPDFYTAPASAPFATETIRTTLQQFAAWQDSGAIDMGQLARNYERKKQLIESGAIGMWDGNDAEDAWSFRYGIAPFPRDGGGYGGSIEGFAISAGTQHPEAAWRWLAFLSRQQLQRPFSSRLQTISSAPARRSVAEGSYLKELSDEERATMLHLLEQEPSSVSERTLSDASNARTDGLFAAAEQLFAGNGAEAALQAGEQAYTAALAAAPNAAPTANAAIAQVVVATPQPTVVAAPDAIPLSMELLWDDGITQQLIDQFNRENPDIFVTLSVNSSTARTYSIPDTVTGDIGFVSGLGENLLDLRPLMDADASFPADDLLAAARADATRDGTIMALPFSMVLTTVAYNRALFTERGVPPPGPVISTDDLFSLSARLRDGDRYGYEHVSTSTFEYVLQQRGISIAALSQGIIPATDPRVRDAIVAFADFARTSTSSTELGDYRNNWASSSSAINEGRIGIWEQYGIAEPDQYPGLATENIGLALLDLSERRYGASLLGINANTAHPEAAWRAISWLSAQPAFIAQHNGFPARRSVLRDPAFAASLPEAARPLIPAALNILEQDPAPVPEGGVNTGDVMYWLYDVTDTVIRKPTSDVERLLEDAQRTMDSYRACMQTMGDMQVCGKRVDPDYRGVFQPPAD